MIYLSKVTDDDVPIPIIHPCKPERVGKDMTGSELHEFGLFMFMAFHRRQDFELYAINLNPENGAPNVMIFNPQKVLLYVWVKTGLAPTVPTYVPNETHDTIMKLCKEYHAVPCFASITISCASISIDSIPKCGGEYYVMLNEFEEI
jgi:hypothetical protein